MSTATATATAAAPATGHLQVVTFRLADEDYAIEITRVKEIILVQGITRVPQVPAFIEGVINLRGSVIPVIDLRKRLEVATSAPGEQGRIVIGRLGDGLVGLVVDAVTQVMRIPGDRIQPPPASIAGVSGEYLTGIAKLDGRMVILLDLDRIFSTDQRDGLRQVRA